MSRLSAFESQHTDSVRELEEPVGMIGKSPCFGANDAEEEVLEQNVNEEGDSQRPKKQPSSAGSSELSTRPLDELLAEQKKEQEMIKMMAKATQDADKSATAATATGITSFTAF